MSEKVVLAESNGDEFDCPTCENCISHQGHGQKATCADCGTEFVLEGIYCLIRYDDQPNKRK